VSEPLAPEDNIEMSMFYQSMLSWKNLQAWAQRVWTKHYQQSPVGSTQNVRPIIVHGVLGIEYLSSAAESSPSDHNAPVSESETKFSYHGNLQPANQHAASVTQNSSPSNQNEVPSAAQPTGLSLVTANQNESLNTAVQSANQSTVMANQNTAAGRGSGHGDAAVNRLVVRSQLDVTSAIERDLQAAAARHRDRLACQTRMEHALKTNSNKSRCTYAQLMNRLMLASFLTHIFEKF